MKQKIVLLTVAACSLCAVAAVSAPRMQPGLWNFSTDIDMGMAMPQMPPEVVAMMKARGMNVPVPGAPMVSQVCITPDQAAKANPIEAQQAMSETGCSMQNVKQGANTYSADMVCTGERMNGKGHTEVVFTGANSVKMQSTFTGTSMGRPVNNKTNVTASFVSANCGSVKPITARPIPMPPKPPGN